MAFASLPPTVNTSKNRVPVAPRARRTANPRAQGPLGGNQLVRLRRAPSSEGAQATRKDVVTR